MRDSRNRQPPAGPASNRNRMHVRQGRMVAVQWHGARRGKVEGWLMIFMSLGLPLDVAMQHRTHTVRFLHVIRE